MESSQLGQYVPVLLLALVAIGFAAGTLLVSVIVGWRSKRNKMKDTAYECGMLPIGEGSTRMSVKFYLVAMLFILFDIEIVFMYPWAVVFREFVATKGPSIFWSMLSFAGILTVGYVYAIMKGALDWKR